MIQFIDINDIQKKAQGKELNVIIRSLVNRFKKKTEPIQDSELPLVNITHRLNASRTKDFICKAFDGTISATFILNTANSKEATSYALVNLNDYIKEDYKIINICYSGPGQIVLEDKVLFWKNREKIEEGSNYNVSVSIY